MRRFVAMPLRFTRPEASYLTWIDCGDMLKSGRHDISRAGGVFKYFLDHGVALTDGAAFADSSAVRLNFGTRRAVVDEGLECVMRAVTALQK